LFSQEFTCLQEKYENITSEDCRKQVRDLTNLESEHIVDFDELLARECEPMLKQYCQVINSLLCSASWVSPKLKGFLKIYWNLKIFTAVLLLFYELSSIAFCKLHFIMTKCTFLYSDQLSYNFQTETELISLSLLIIQM